MMNWRPAEAALYVTCHSNSFILVVKERWSWNAMVLSFQSLGVVYGRLCTAPLYVFGAIQSSDINSHDRIYELFSFIFWTLTLIPLLKYALLLLAANDDGEGGMFSLYSLLCRNAKVGLLPSDKVASEIMDYDEVASAPSSKRKRDSRARRAIEKHKSSHYLILLVALFGACMIIAPCQLMERFHFLNCGSLILLDMMTGFYQRTCW